MTIDLNALKRIICFLREIVYALIIFNPTLMEPVEAILRLIDKHLLAYTGDPQNKTSAATLNSQMLLEARDELGVHLSEDQFHVLQKDARNSITRPNPYYAGQFRNWKDVVNGLRHRVEATRRGDFVPPIFPQKCPLWQLKSTKY